jgi:hypothetical protein
MGRERPARDLADLQGTASDQNTGPEGARLQSRQNRHDDVRTSAPEVRFPPNPHFFLRNDTTAVRALPTLFNSRFPFISSGPDRFKS